MLYLYAEVPKKLLTQLKNNSKLLTAIINRYQSKIFQNEIVQKFIGSNIFEQLNDYIKNQELLENHRTYLIKLIVEIYIKIRVCHFLKESNMKTTERQHYKLTLFKGQ